MTLQTLGTSVNSREWYKHFSYKIQSPTKRISLVWNVNKNK